MFVYERAGWERRHVKLAIGADLLDGSNCGSGYECARARDRSSSAIETETRADQIKIDAIWQPIELSPRAPLP